MKYLKNFKLFETGEWSSFIDLNYVLENPDCTDEECAWIKQLLDQLEIIKDNLNNKSIFEIIDIRGIDMYQGPYASVKIFNKPYTIYQIDNYGDLLWIKNFPVNNNSEEGNNPGFQGYEYQISNLLNQIDELGGDVNIYKKLGKYNL